MKISIAMVTYNGAKCLQDQFDSFMGQARLPDELVVCDEHLCGQGYLYTPPFVQVGIDSSIGNKIYYSGAID